MSAIAEQIVRFLRNSTAIEATFGSSRAIFYGHVPTWAPPAGYMFIQAGDINNDLCMDGTAGLRRAEFDVDVIDGDLSGAESSADVVESVLHGYRGAIVSSTVSSWTPAFSKGSFLTNRRHSFELSGIEDDEGFHTVSFNWTLWYTTV